MNGEKKKKKHHPHPHTGLIPSDLISLGGAQDLLPKSLGEKAAAAADDEDHRHKSPKKTYTQFQAGFFQEHGRVEEPPRIRVALTPAHELQCAGSERRWRWESWRVKEWPRSSPVDDQSSGLS